MTSQNSALTQSTRPHKKGSLPDIPWTANNNELILLLLGEMEKRENAKVLFAKEKEKESSLQLVAVLKVWLDFGSIQLHLIRTPVTT